MAVTRDATVEQLLREVDHVARQLVPAGVDVVVRVQTVDHAAQVRVNVELSGGSMKYDVAGLDPPKVKRPETPTRDRSTKALARVGGVGKPTTQPPQQTVIAVEPVITDEDLAPVTITLPHVTTRGQTFTFSKGAIVIRCAQCNDTGMVQTPNAVAFCTCERGRSKYQQMVAQKHNT